MRPAAAKIAEWRVNPVQFVRDVFGVEPDAWQKVSLMNYAQNTRSGAKACKGPGKTALLAWVGWHFLSVWPHPKIAATSITADNLNDGLWSEMAKWQKKSKWLSAEFTWFKTRIIHNEHPETWFMSARTWSKSASPEQQADALAGFHGDYVLYLLDEGGSIPDAVMAAAEAALANAGTEVNPNAIAKMVMMGNPTQTKGPLYRACTSEAHLWKMIEITGDPDDPARSPRISAQWAREQIEKYGRDHPWVMVNVLGKFPPTSLNALLGPDEVEAAMSRTMPMRAIADMPKQLGIDIALYGDDETIIAARQGKQVFNLVSMRQQDSMAIAARIIQADKQWGGEDGVDQIALDGSGGWGDGTLSALRNTGYDPIDVQFGSTRVFNRKYKNRRSEMAWNLAEWVKAGGCLPKDPLLKAELCALEYFLNIDGTMQIVEKSQIKAELGRSPDRADAVMCTFAFPAFKKPPKALADAMTRYGSSNDYNPLERGAPRSYGFEDDHTIQRSDDYNPLG